MKRRAPLLIATAFATLTACGDGAQQYDAPQAPDAQERRPDEAMGPCATTGTWYDSGWGDIQHPYTAIHVRADGHDGTGDGTLSKPFATVQQALAQADWIASPYQPPAPPTAPASHSLDFDTDASGNPISAGQDLADVYGAWGVAIEAWNKNENQQGRAIAFDSANPTGGDADLGTPNSAYGGPGLGNDGSSNDTARGMLMIKAENTNDADGDGLVDSPDDDGGGAWLYFTFDSPKCVDGLGVIDVESNETPAGITMYDAGGNPMGGATWQGLGDNSYEYVDVGTCGVSEVRVHFTASGAISSLDITDDIPDASDEPPLAFEPIYIAVGPGEFSTRVLADSASAPGPVHIEGCSRQETVLSAKNPLAPIVDVRGSVLSLRGVDLVGGRRGIFVRNGARFSGARLASHDATRNAFLASTGSEISLNDVKIVHPRPDSGFGGWGVGLQNASADLRNLDVDRAYQAAVFADASSLQLTDSKIHDTQSLGEDGLGRGIHAQRNSWVSITDTDFTNNKDTAIFGLDLAYLNVNGILIDITGAGYQTDDAGNGILIDITGAGLVTTGGGDGIVLSGVTRMWDAIIADSVVTGSERAGIVLDGVEALVENTETWGNGLSIGGTSIVQQSNAVVDSDVPTATVNPGLALQTDMLAKD